MTETSNEGRTSRPFFTREETSKYTDPLPGGKVRTLSFDNDLVPEGATVDRHSLPRIQMPARDRFIYDDRSGGSIGR